MPRASSRSSLTGELGLLARLRDQPARAGGIGLQALLGEPEGERHADQPLLGAVVQVALDAPALLVGGGDDALAGVAQVVDALAQRARPAQLGRLAGEADATPRTCDLSVTNGHAET